MIQVCNKKEQGSRNVKIFCQISWENFFKGKTKIQSALF